CSHPTVRNVARPATSFQPRTAIVTVSAGHVEFFRWPPIVTRARSRMLKVAIEAWPIAGSFTISRGSKTQADVVVVELRDGEYRGRGECTPYPRYGETAAGVAAAIEALRQPLLDGLDRAGLQRLLPGGAARNGLDCAFWDLEAKQSGRPAYV